MEKTEIFNSDIHGCCIEIGNFRLENPPEELIKMLIGKTLKECEEIIEEYLNPKKVVVKWNRKIGFEVPGTK